MSISVRLVLFGFVVLCISSCEISPNHNYEYHKGLARFLKEISGINLNELDNKKLLLVDISCEECVISKLDFLRTQNSDFDIKIYLLGDSTDSKLSREFESIIIGYDLESKYHIYETGISMPLLIDVQDGVIKEHFFVNDFNQFDVLNYLNQPVKQLPSR
jgi:hypothetical protein